MRFTKGTNVGWMLFMKDPFTGLWTPYSYEMFDTRSKAREYKKFKTAGVGGDWIKIEKVRRTTTYQLETRKIGG